MNKKNTALVILAIGLFLFFAGFYLYKNSRTVNNAEELPVTSEFSKEDAALLIKEKVRKISSIYTSPEANFQIEGDKLTVGKEKVLRIKVLNYDAVLTSLFSENGKKEVENKSLKNSKYVLKKDGDIYLLTEVFSDDKYKNLSLGVSEISMSDTKITALVTFSVNYINNSNIFMSESTAMDIVLVKKDEEWLVDSFDYMLL